MTKLKNFANVFKELATGKKKMIKPYFKPSKKYYLFFQVKYDISMQAYLDIDFNCTYDGMCCLLNHFDGNDNLGQIKLNHN